MQHIHMPHATATLQAPLLLDHLAGLSAESTCVQPAVRVRRHEQMLAECSDRRTPDTHPGADDYHGSAPLLDMQEQEALFRRQSTTPSILNALPMPYTYSSLSRSPHAAVATASSARLHSLQKPGLHQASSFGVPSGVSPESVRTGTPLPVLYLAPEEAFHRDTASWYHTTSVPMLSASSSASSFADGGQLHRYDGNSGGGQSAHSSYQESRALATTIAAHESHARGPGHFPSILASTSDGFPIATHAGETPLPSAMSHLPHAPPSMFQSTHSFSSCTTQGSASGSGTSNSSRDSCMEGNDRNADQADSTVLVASAPSGSSTAPDATKSCPNAHSEAAHSSKEWSQDDILALVHIVNEVDGRSWTEIARRTFPNEKFDSIECQDKWRELSKEKTFTNRGPWTHEEDQALIEAVNLFRPEKWVVVATQVAHRNGKQCRERWHNHLSPLIKKGPFTPEEDEMIFHLYSIVGSKWSEIAKHVPGRPDNMIKNHFNTSLQRQRRRLRIQELVKPEGDGTVSIPSALTSAGIGSTLTSSPQMSTSLGEKFALFAKQSRAASSSASLGKRPPLEFPLSLGGSSNAGLGLAPTSPYSVYGSELSPPLHSASFQYPSSVVSAGPLTTTYSDRYRYILPLSASHAAPSSSTSPTLPARFSHSSYKSPSYHPYVRSPQSQPYPHTQPHPFPSSYNEYQKRQDLSLSSEAGTYSTPPPTPDAVTNIAPLPPEDPYSRIYHYSSSSPHVPASAPSNVEYFTVPRRPDGGRAVTSPSELASSAHTRYSPKTTPASSHAPVFGRKALTLPPSASGYSTSDRYLDSPESQVTPGFGTRENTISRNSSLGLILTPIHHTSPTTPQIINSGPSAGSNLGQRRLFSSQSSTFPSQQNRGHSQTVSPQAVYDGDYRDSFNDPHDTHRPNSVSSSIGSLPSPRRTFISPPSYPSHPPVSSSASTAATSLSPSLASFSVLSHASYASSSSGNQSSTHAPIPQAGTRALPDAWHVQGEVDDEPFIPGPGPGFDPTLSQSQPLTESESLGGARPRASSDVVASTRQNNPYYYTLSSSCGRAGDFAAGPGPILTQAIPEEAEQSTAKIASSDQNEDDILLTQITESTHLEGDTEMQ